jgi:hypothetical protein
LDVHSYLEFLPDETLACCDCSHRYRIKHDHNIHPR